MGGGGGGVGCVGVCVCGGGGRPDFRPPCSMPARLPHLRAHPPMAPPTDCVVPTCRRCTACCRASGSASPTWALQVRTMLRATWSRCAPTPTPAAALAAPLPTTGSCCSGQVGNVAGCVLGSRAGGHSHSGCRRACESASHLAEAPHLCCPCRPCHRRLYAHGHRRRPPCWALAAAAQLLAHRAQHARCLGTRQQQRQQRQQRQHQQQRQHGRVAVQQPACAAHRDSTAVCTID